MHTIINAAVIEDNKLLMFLKKGDCILPGGKPLPEESDSECIMREFSEENPGTEIEVLGFYNEFIGKAPHRTDELKHRVYFVKRIKKSMKTSAEIERAEFVYDFDKYKISDVTNKVIASLRKDGYLK